MTNPNDLIRRGDALAELDSNAKGTIRLGGQNFRTIQLEEAAAAIAALPAVNTDPIGYISAVTDPQIATLQATNARLVEALRFYGGVMPASFAPGQDGGYRARALLSELEAK